MDAGAMAGTIDRVNARLYIGGYLAAANPATIRQLGITRIVKMFKDSGAYPGGYHRHQGVAYAVFPALDSPEYDIRSDAVAALRFMNEGLKADERVLVHCHAGVSRSSTVVLFHLMIHGGYDLGGALRLLKSVRPGVNPNIGFMRHLSATDASLRRLRAIGCAKSRRAPHAAEWIFAEHDDSTPL